MLAALAALAITAATTTRAQEPMLEVTVREGDTCRGIARRVYGDADAYDRIHAHNPQLGPTPHRLRPGTVLRLPPPSPPAHLTAIERTVERRAPEQPRFVSAREGQPLPRGTQVRTHDASSAEITFRDRAQVTVRERTLVIVYGGRRRLAQRRITRAELERGALRSRLGELAGRAPLEVETPSSHASLDGDAVVSVEEDGTSRVSNHGRRAATVEAGGARVRLPAGTGTVVRRGQRPSRPRRLLAAPRWRADRRGPVLGYVGAGATLSGGFEPVEGAARYRVEVARTPEGAELLATLALPGDARRFEASGVPEGTVYVSVASIDDTGLEGRRSPWRAFSVRLARLVAPGGGAATITTNVPVVWPGTWLVAPRGLECAMGEGAPSGIVTLREQIASEVRCLDRAGAEAGRLPVEVVAPELAVPGDAALVRDRRTAIRLSVSAPSVEGGDDTSVEPPPVRVLAATVPEGFRAGRVTEADGALSVDVWAAPNAPGTAALTLEVLAGAERIPIGSVVLLVRDATASSPPIATAPEPEPTRPRPAQGAFGDLAWASSLGLRDERRGGFGAWIYAAPIEAPTEPQLRVGVGARAQLPDTPLRLGFASQLDVLGDPPAARPPGRRGDADLLASVGLLLLDEGPLGAALDVSAWIPTREEPESLGRVRLAPSLEGSWRPVDWLALRTRQGAIVDADAEGARLWSWALGLDVAPLPWLAVGAELDASVGRFADRDGAALALGGAIEARWEILDVAAGARFALTDEARALLGAWSAVLTVRVSSR